MSRGRRAPTESNVSNENDPADTEGTLERGGLTGLGMGDPTFDGLMFGGIESLDIALGDGVDDFSIVSSGRRYRYRCRWGDDRLTMAADPSRIAGTLRLQAGDDELGTLVIAPPVASTLTLDSSADGALGVLTGPAMPGQIEFGQFPQLRIDLSDSDDLFRIQDTTTGVTLNAGDGRDLVEITTISHAATINPGPEKSLIRVFDNAALLTVVADGSPDNTLIIDRSAVTAAEGASIEDGTTLNSGAVRDLTQADIDFSGLARVDLEMGQGNDQITMDTALSGTVVNLDGNAGDDRILVRQIGGETNVLGGDNEDTLTVDIDGFPTANQFVDLNLDVETLVVDNSDSTRATAWVSKAGLLTAATIPGGLPVDVIGTDGVGLTRIIGGTASDTLDIQSGSGNVEGRIDGNSVELLEGLVVLEPTGSQGYDYYESVVGFDDLVDGAASYREDGFLFSNGTTLVRDDTTSPALREAATLTVKLDSKGAFAFYAIDLAAPSLEAGQSVDVTVAGTTLNGSPLEQVATVQGGGGFTTFDSQFGNFTGLKELTFTSGSGTDIVFDNFIAREIISGGATAVTVEEIATATLVGDSSGNIVIDADEGTISGIGDGQLINGVPVEVSVINGNILQFRFGGNLIIGDGSVETTVKVKENTNPKNYGISILAAGDVEIGDKTTFEFAAVDHVSGAGGGDGSKYGLAGEGGDGSDGGADGGDGGTGGAGGTGTDYSVFVSNPNTRAISGTDGSPGLGSDDSEAGDEGIAGDAGDPGINAAHSGGTGGMESPASNPVSGRTGGSGGDGGTYGAHGDEWDGTDGTDGDPGGGHNLNGLPGNDGDDGDHGTGGRNTGSRLNDFRWWWWWRRCCWC